MYFEEWREFDFSTSRGRTFQGKMGKKACLGKRLCKSNGKQFSRAGARMH